MLDDEDGQLPEVLSEASRRRRHTKSRRQNDHFVRGPIPMPWMERAARLPGKALAVGLLLWFIKGIVRDGPIKLSTSLLARFSVGRKAAGRALTSLEHEGLIRAQRSRGQLPRVWLEVPEK